MDALTCISLQLRALVKTSHRKYVDNQ